MPLGKWVFLGVLYPGAIPEKALIMTATNQLNESDSRFSEEKVRPNWMFS